MSQNPEFYDLSQDFDNSTSNSFGHNTHLTNTKVQITKLNNTKAPTNHSYQTIFLIYLPKSNKRTQDKPLTRG